VSIVDVAIVGAGTAGAAAAALCARRGLKVVCVDRRPLDQAGARWVNDVPGWTFDEAGIARPRGAEVVGAPGDFHLVAGWGPRRVVVPPVDAVAVDMRALVARLQRMAAEGGADLRGGVQVEGVRDGALVLPRGDAIRATWVIDASGLAGAHLLAGPAARADLCAAAQEVRLVRDRAAAEAFFRDNGARPTDTLCFSGIAGGYSIVNVRLAGDQVSILTGSIPADGHRSGLDLLAAFVESHAWIGDRVYGGARAIPLGSANDTLAAGNVATIGDAALQVFSAHGSGIGAGLIAARMLADALVGNLGVDGYARAWQRRFGGLHAGYDLMRRFTQVRRAAEVDAMIGSGLLDASSVAAALEQRWPSPSPREALRIARAALRSPLAALRLAPVALRMPAVALHYARYPLDASALPRWTKRRDAFVGVRG
jgi:flavin-dependent dehydrogenase